MPDIQAAVINQLNLVVKDKLASIAFYKLLGVQLELSTRADWNKHHAAPSLQTASASNWIANPSPNSGILIGRKEEGVLAG